MATVQDVLSIAKSQVGYSRWDDPEQGTKYGRWYAELTGASYYGQNGVPYCAMFVSWVFDRAGVRCAGVPGAYCPSMLDEAEEEGRTVPISSARAGDVVYFEWDSDGESDHVGIVEDNDGSCLYTIEGNTSTGSTGSQSNGGVVACRQRSYANVCGIVRPYYDDAGQGGTVSHSLDVDGIVGPLTISEWQRQLGTTVDGVVSGQIAEQAIWYPNMSDACEWGGTGSELMKAVQKAVGVSPQTGVIGRGTVCMLQGWLNLRGYDTGWDENGVLSKGTAAALQQSLNDRAWA